MQFGNSQEKINLTHIHMAKKEKTDPQLKCKAQWFKLFPELGLKVEIPKTFVEELIKITDKILKDPDKIDHSTNLAGQISKGQQISLPLNYNKKIVEFQNIIKNCSAQLIRETAKADSNGINLWSDFDMDLSNMWIVDQKEHDYNPLHTHGGTLSGILYLKVPEQINEKNEPHGWLSFGGPWQYRPENLSFKMNELILPKEGDMYFFRAQLPHQVYPFKGEGERRSISFNLKANPKGIFFDY